MVKKEKEMRQGFFLLVLISAKLLNVNISSKQTMLHAFTTQDVLELLVNSFNAAADGICSYNSENLSSFKAERAIDTYSRTSIVLT